MFFRNPLYVTKGWMQWLWNEKNERFLDLFGGIVTVSVGHCHPRVNAALHEQIDTLWHTTSIYLHPKIHEYAERLVQVRNGSLVNWYYGSLMENIHWLPSKNLEHQMRPMRFFIILIFIQKNLQNSDSQV